jgi:8-oxo-dGTP diphosphatase
MFSPPKGIDVLARARIERQNNILVCRNLKHGHCYLPGGHVDPGEAASAALLRELDEEAGLGDATIGECLLVDEHRFVQRGTPKHELSIVFHVELPARLAGGPVPIESLEPGIGFEWWGLDSLSEARLLPESLVPWLQGREEMDKACWRGSLQID